LQTVRDFQSSDVETLWSVRATSVSTEVYPITVNPSRSTWSDDSGWANLLIPSSRNPALAVSLQLKLVTVDRAWLDATIFDQHNWYKADDNGHVIVLSTGQSLADLNGKKSGSLMLLLPIQFLLARKVAKVGNWTLADEQTLPLSLKPSADDPAIGSKPAVIAVICRRIPRSPRPDPNLEWPGGKPQ
jgi:hypothetical protein